MFPPKFNDRFGNRASGSPHDLLRLTIIDPPFFLTAFAHFGFSVWEGRGPEEKMGGSTIVEGDFLFRSRTFRASESEVYYGRSGGMRLKMPLFAFFSFYCPFGQNENKYSENRALELFLIVRPTK